MPRWVYLMLAADPKKGIRTILQSFLVMAIASVYALIRIALFGETSDGYSIEGIIVLIVSIILSEVIMKKFSKKK